LKKTILSFTAIITLFAIAAAQSVQHSSDSKTAANTRTHAASSPRQPSLEELNSFMHHMFGYDANLKWKIESVKPSEVPGVTEVVILFGEPPQQQRTPFYVGSDLQHAFVGEIIPFGADPFAPARSKLAAEAKGPVTGAANAPVEIVEFSDFQCPHCKRAQPILEKLMSESPNARLVFENFPLSQIHKWAERAADYADCIARRNPEHFWKFAKDVYDQQEQINDENAAAKLAAIATGAGEDASATAICADSPETKARVNQQYELGVSVGVNATPTVFVNGRKVERVLDTPYEVLKQMVDFEAQETKK
jgi:protein-disulfide isomerase